MSLQTPPKEKPELTGVEGGEKKSLLGGGKSSSSSTSGEQRPEKKVLGIKDPDEQDIMWKLKVRCTGWCQPADCCAASACDCQPRPAALLPACANTVPRVCLCVCRF